MTTLAVPGAQLHYLTQGHGPLLVLIPGANGDGAIFQPVAQRLAEHFTVVTYDRRGFSSSPLEGGHIPEHRLRTDADDVRRLIEHLGPPTANVFGSSSGAMVALHVLIHHPSVVQTLIAHEPPAVALLPEPARWRATFDGVHATYRRDGVAPALRQFMEAVLGPHEDLGMKRAHEARSGEHVARNITYWLEHELRQYSGASLDLEALRAHRERLLLVNGRQSREPLPAQPNKLLARQLGLEVHEVTGGHVGYASHPAEFAAELLALLAARNR